VPKTLTLFDLAAIDNSGWYASSQCVPKPHGCGEGKAPAAVVSSRMTAAESLVTKNAVCSVVVPTKLTCKEPKEMCRKGAPNSPLKVKEICILKILQETM